MRKIVILLALWLLLVAPICFAQTQNAVTMASGQTSTGVSANTCSVFGYQRLSVFFTLSGTAATVDIECDDGDGTWYILTGSGLPVTDVSAPGETVIGITSYACARVRTNVSVCTSCTVTTKCQKWKSSR